MDLYRAWADTQASGNQIVKGCTRLAKYTHCPIPSSWSLLALEHDKIKLLEKSFHFVSSHFLFENNNKTDNYYIVDFDQKGEVRVRVK